MSKRVADALRVLVRPATPESEALEYRSPHAIAALDDLRQQLAGLPPEDYEGASPPILQAIAELEEALREPAMRIRFRHPTRGEAEVLGRAASLAGYAVRTPERKDEIRAYIVTLDDEELLDAVLEVLGKSRAWVEDSELATPKALLMMAAEDVRERLAVVNGLMDPDVALHLATALQALDANAEMADPEAFLMGPQVHLNDQERQEIATDDDPAESTEQVILRHLRMEAERRALEHKAAKAEYGAYTREKLEATLLHEALKRQQQMVESSRYMMLRLAACTLIESDGKWIPMFDSVDDLDALENEPDDDLRAENMVFLRWLGNEFQVVTQAEANLSRVVASNSFRGDLVSV